MWPLIVYSNENFTSYLEYHLLKLLYVFFVYMNILRLIFILIHLQIRFQWLKKQLKNIKEYQEVNKINVSVVENTLKINNGKFKISPTVVSGFYNGGYCTL